MINAENILRTLPHGYPFVMVDRVVELVPGKRAVAIKTVSEDAFLSGRGRGGASAEIMVLEAMAQVGALSYAFSSAGSDKEPGREYVPEVKGYLAGLNDVVFHIRPSAGDVLELTLEYVTSLGPMARFRGTAKISGKTAVEAGLTFTVEEK